MPSKTLSDFGYGFRFLQFDTTPHFPFEPGFWRIIGAAQAKRTKKKKKHGKKLIRWRDAVRSFHARQAGAWERTVPEDQLKGERTSDMGSKTGWDRIGTGNATWEVGDRATDETSIRLFSSLRRGKCDASISAQRRGHLQFQGARHDRRTGRHVQSICPNSLTLPPAPQEIACRPSLSHTHPRPNTQNLHRHLTLPNLGLHSILHL